MPLNYIDPNSDMYQGWCSATINFIKGRCPFSCEYCKVKNINNYPPRLDEKEFKTKLISYKKREVKDTNDLFGGGKFITEKEIIPLSIFLGSSIDMFADNILDEWIIKVFEYLKLYPLNTYILQTKNPKNMIAFQYNFSKKYLLGITLETNRHFPSIMNKAPSPEERWEVCKDQNIINFCTLEPIIDYDLKQFLQMIIDINPEFINIGANTNTNIQLPEPDTNKLKTLIHTLQELKYDVRLKPNLNRLL
jgi:DNA repair photolyase